MDERRDFGQIEWRTARIVDICANWPGVTRSIKWEVDLVYSVASKMFVVMCALGPDRGRLSFKVDTERFLELTEQPGIAPAHYMARAFWVAFSMSLEAPVEGSRKTNSSATRPPIA